MLFSSRGKLRGWYVTTLRATLDRALGFHQAGNLTQAEILYRQVLQQWPGQPDALNLLGVMANQVGKTEIAIDFISQALARLPNEPDFHGNYASALQNAGRVAESTHHYREAVRLKPSSVTYHVLLSESLQQTGKFDEALALGLEALRLDPYSAEAYCILGDLAADGRYALTDFDVERMKEVLDQGRQTAANASLLCFTLAAHLERVGSYDEAFPYYRRANEYKHEVYLKDNKGFDQAKHRELIDNLIAVFTPEFVAKARTWGIDSEVPVFVVGLVRSGTTLVEQILASHPHVYGAGERKEIDQLATTLHEQMQVADHYPLCLDRLDVGVGRSMAYGYLQRLARLAGSADRIVDKMPHNYLHLGFMGMLFPRAHIIHCRRDPMDVCASAYLQNFKWMTHAATLDDIAFYYHQYIRLMEHWQRVLPTPIHEVVYEEMVADQENMSRKLVAACGLEWDERCLAFYRTERPVQTASKLQVRQPIFHRSVGRWKHFQAHLEPLRLALGVPEHGNPTR
jgi:tetratricopeptide (TPR) repeat protein